MEKKLCISIFLCFLKLSSSAQHPAIGGYNVYYGDIHNHSNISDGTGSPSTAFNYAKNIAHLDFFALTDHSDFLSSTSWTEIRDQANSSNQNGVFAAFYGFEWTSPTGYGHVGVINTTDYSGMSSLTSLQDLVNWLVSHSDGLAFFNHPGKEDSRGHEFSHFTSAAADQIVGMELWNKGDGFNIYYYNDGYYPGDNKGFFDEALERGWKIGAMGSGDNHSGTWGTSVPYRMAVLANNLTRSDLLTAMRQRRFFSTLDKNLSLSFKLNGSEMGSTLTSGNYTARIQATDADGEIFTRVLIYDKNHNILHTWNLSSYSVDVSLNLLASDGDYFYVKVTQTDGNEAISSPIWISGGRSNQNPDCSIISPANGTEYTAPANIRINANASDPDGSVTKVEFYQGTSKLGEDLTSPYTFNWNGVTRGSYTITARATDNSGAISTSSEISITVARMPITVTAYSQKKVYGEYDPVLTYQITSGALMGSDTFSGTLTRNAGEDIGNYEISQGTLSLGPNYDLTFMGADLEIRARAIIASGDDLLKIYGDADHLSYRITSGTLVGSDTFTGSIMREPGENVGSYSIKQGSLALSPNYTFTFRESKLTITPRPIIVTADFKTKEYGNSDPELTYHITSGNLVIPDSFTGSLARDAGENIGSYAITQSSLALSKNYALTFTEAILIISPRQITITAYSGTKVYGESDPLLTYQITSGKLVSSDGIIGELSRNIGEDVGTYSISKGSLELTDNYNLNFESAMFEITPRPVTVKALARRKVFGEPDPEYTYQIISGTLINTDSFSGFLIRDPGESIGTYSINLGSLALSNNYSLTFIGADFTITKNFEISVYPNPFEDVLNFDFDVNQKSEICIEIYNLKGIKIANVFCGTMVQNFYHFVYFFDHLSSGFYIYKLRIEGKVTAVGKVIHKK